MIEVENMSDLKKERDRFYKSVSSICEKHQVNCVQLMDREPFCPLCASERTDESELNMREKETKKAYNKNKRWLSQRSVLTDEEMFNMTFESFKEVDTETKENKAKALEIARELFKGSKHNEMLAGGFGTGKTHLAMAMLNELNKHADMKLLFVSIDELMRRIKSNFHDHTSVYKEDVIVQTLIEADVLVIDDIGAEVGSVDRKSEATDYNVRVLNAVLSGRTSKPTIFTTNLSGKDLTQMYDGRIVSRIRRGITKERTIVFKTTEDKRGQLDF